MHAELLNNKKILVAVTGSIAVYKTLELIRLYVKAGAQVRVIMTQSAQRFISALTFETISQHTVLTEESECWDKDSIYNHIAIGKWADIFVIAPASVNTINKLRHGIADNLLTQTAIAYPQRKLLCPAANTNMLHNAITQESLEILQKSNYVMVEPVSKELACRDIGNGAMSDVEDIFYATARELLQEQYWSNREVVLSGGGTIEKLDDVRYISNFSSGKMASSLALAFYLKGANVRLVSTRGHENLPKTMHVVPVQSSEEMYEHLQENVHKAKKNSPKTPYLFMVAAVSDYVPENVQEGKLKKEFLGTLWKIELKQNMDILHSLDKKDVISVGFKAEMDELVASSNAKNMLSKKELDVVCLNVLNDSKSFGSTQNSIELYCKNKEEAVSFSGEKLQLSLALATHLQKEFSEQ
ncbi:bifunctional phosphopantothenoylcysteine decarboxylase/phosphopantothenate--cysteine ligase CoaBC [Candidatus Marinarcus aquaticus]|uniref:Coenzyme A biosynthesis bifunctional protein CoaBC n=1 Tax=Candidatus Marinarcus aquaticus TaxID=2044504 RepID=A0A4V1LNL3_9BACT|nr:bifunctional phosphopantothenoylcysteine decarboxylase/phosphopantothenate--cysteine ligase CoaBC [Candidatus Marinarcus aquaticus]RXJ53800.1 bifunctional phosphopantothenoylcysteine decarboxylase/phosphopantothenate--cysteine ligase CoaBC [Candidatus Marinarcus aquaticus]